MFQSFIKICIHSFSLSAVLACLPQARAQVIYQIPMEAQPHVCPFCFPRGQDPFATEPQNERVNLVQEMRNILNNLPPINPPLVKDLRRLLELLRHIDHGATVPRNRFSKINNPDIRNLARRIKRYATSTQVPTLQTLLTKFIHKIRFQQSRNTLSASKKLLSSPRQLRKH